MLLHTENLTSADFRYVNQSQLRERFPWGTSVKTFFQIDLSKTYRLKITAIATQGGANVNTEWMKQYRLRFFVGAKPVPYTESGIGKVRYNQILFLACNQVIRRLCWWCVGGQHNRIFYRRIYMKIGFSSQRNEVLLLWTLTHHQRGCRDVTCKQAIFRHWKLHKLNYK